MQTGKIEETTTNTTGASLPSDRKEGELTCAFLQDLINLKRK